MSPLKQLPTYTTCIRKYIRDRLLKNNYYQILYLHAIDAQNQDANQSAVIETATSHSLTIRLLSRLRREYRLRNDCDTVRVQNHVLYCIPGVPGGQKFAAYLYVNPLSSPTL